MGRATVAPHDACQHSGVTGRKEVDRDLLVQDGAELMAAPTGEDSNIVSPKPSDDGRLPAALSF